MAVPPHPTRRKLTPQGYETTTSAQKTYTIALRSGEIVRTIGWSAKDVLWRTLLRTKFSSRYFGGQPDQHVAGSWKLPEAAFRQGDVGRADCKRRARAVQFAARGLGVQYPANTWFASIARMHWHAGPEQVHTVLSARQG